MRESSPSWSASVVSRLITAPVRMREAPSCKVRECPFRLPPAPVTVSTPFSPKTRLESSTAPASVIAKEDPLPMLNESPISSMPPSSMRSASSSNSPKSMVTSASFSITTVPAVIFSPSDTWLSPEKLTLSPAAKAAGASFSSAKDLLSSLVFQMRVVPSKIRLSAQATLLPMVHTAIAAIQERTDRRSKTGR